MNSAANPPAPEAGATRGSDAGDRGFTREVVDGQWVYCRDRSKDFHLPQAACRVDGELMRVPDWNQSLIWQVAVPN